jgi:hypothetical protein
MKGKGSLSKLTGFIGLYALYVFLAGHAFFENYYGTFGIDPRWLDLGFAEVIIRGFTLLFLAQGFYLWPIYIFVFISPIIFELTSQISRRALLQACIIAVLLCLFPATYLAAANAGASLAHKNMGEGTSMPYMTFSTATGKFGGRLLLFRAGMVFVHAVAPVASSGQPDSINLHVYRTEDIRDFEVTERPE